MHISAEDFQQSTMANLIRLGQSYCPTELLNSLQFKASQPCTKPPMKPISLFRPWDDQPTDKPSNSPPVKSAPIRDQSAVSSPSATVTKGLQESLPKLSDLHSSFELLATNVGKSSVGHVCIYCGKVYSRKYGLKIHLRTHTGFKPLSCKVCHRQFSDPSNLNKHSRLHSDMQSTQHQCELCGKLMIRKRDLDRHMQTRHADDFLDVVNV